MMKRFQRDVAAVSSRWANGRMLRTPVFLGGESGSGKGWTAEQIAKTMDVPLHVVDLSALSDGLIESELFGHLRGAFTGAEKTRRGRLEEEGVILIDEIGKAPLHIQAKLLRVIDTGYVQPVGSNKQHLIRSPIILAAMEDIDELVRAGRFLPDLWHRIVVRLRVPSLREHIEDLPRLLTGFALSLGVTVEPAAVDVLKRCHWPGNVRELRGFVERCAMLHGDVITASEAMGMLDRESRDSLSAQDLLREGATIDQLAKVWRVPYSTAAARLANGGFECSKRGRRKVYKFPSQILADS